MESLVQAREHIDWLHGDTKGYITLLRKHKDGSVKQWHYKPDEAKRKLDEWLGEDFFMSQQSFYRPQRSVETVKELGTLFIDLDCYLLNYDPEYVLMLLEDELFKRKLPEPNFIIFSGRGIVLVWLIEHVPYKALPLWQVIQNHFCKLLKNFGADVKALDAARVFRVAGSINSKNGETVHVQYRHAYRYILRDIQHEYLPELNPEKEKKKGRKKKVVQLYNIYRLHYARLRDLLVIVELRAYDVTGYRETICFLYRYWSCCVLNDPEEALERTLELNARFTLPLPQNEVIRATKSAEKAWNARDSKQAHAIARELGYPGAGYNLKNEKIISWLDITEEEQQHLETIIGKKEYRRRDAVYQREKRQEVGALTREEYLEQEKEKTDDKLYLLKIALKRNPKASQRQLAKQLNCSVGLINRLLKKKNGKK